MSISLEGEARKPSLLIIDDQPENIRLLVRILNQAGYLDITTATDPARVSELHALCIISTRWWSKRCHGLTGSRVRIRSSTISAEDVKALDGHSITSSSAPLM